MRLLPVLRYRRGVAAVLMLAAIATCTAARNRDKAQTTADEAQITADASDTGLDSGGVVSLNYTPWYIHTSEITGPDGSGVQGGGPNVMPADADGHPSGGGKEVCCMTYPTKWQPDLRLTIRWLVNKKRDGKGYWYKAENVRIAPYDGKTAGNTWVIFLPGDRVRLMITDGHKGGNDPDQRPTDDDPLVVKGVPDREWNELFPNGVAKGVQ